MKSKNLIIQTIVSALLFFIIITLPTCSSFITLEHPILNTEIPSEWEDEAVIILSDSVELELKDMGKENNLLKKQITWYKINDASTDDLKTIYIWFYDYLGKKPAVDITAIYKKNKIKKIYTYEHLDSLVYKYWLKGHKAGSEAFKISIPDYSDLKYLRIETRWHIKRVEEYGHFTIRNFSYNTMEKNITLIWPADFSLNYGLENKEGLNVKKAKSEINGKNVFTLSAKNIVEIQGEENYKYPEQWFAALVISFPPNGNKSYTWKEIGQHYFNLIYDSIAKHDTSVIDSIAGTISGSFEDEILQNTFNYVKDNVRYYGSWEGCYGWIPRGPQEILEKGYGDCKEMANLLAMILRAKGFNSSITLLRRNKEDYFKFIEKYPSLDLSDHMITCVTKSNGQKLYLDATTKKSFYNTSYCEYLNNQVLVISENQSHLDIVKPLPDYQNRIVTNSEIIPSSYENGWLIKGKAQFTGEIAEIIYWDEKNRENLEKSKLVLNTLKNYLKIPAQKGVFSKLSPSEVIIDFVADFSQCILTSPAKGIIFSLPSIYTPDYEYADLSYEGGRYLQKIEQTDTWIVPNGFSTYNFSNLTHQYGKGSWQKSKNTASRSYSCEFTHIESSERDNLKKFFNERSHFERGITWSK